MSEEQWADIDGYEGQYQVSTAGRVRSLLNNKRFYRAEPKILSQRLNQGGYRCVGLSTGPTVRSFAVAKLVIRAFGPPEEPGMTCDHINRERTDNRIENLRWATMKEQCTNRVQSIQTGEDHVNSKLTAAAVTEIRRRRALGEDLAAIADDFGITASHVWSVASGRAWKHLPIAGAA